MNATIDHPTIGEWEQLVLREVSMREVLTAVNDVEWQAFRVSLYGTNLVEKYVRLRAWLSLKGFTRQARVQVSNYINALKRGGLVK